eukprot:TRINITY_DN21320_c0_g1_i1.p1 TRINITY_DN21320_c0_g1~~TRINITY_DN21320_c0_g1_i1.p1  ORF type:complete len:439 (-),score=80.23 TRINITY_DN21320_c0_g1_i1:6-1301(-)
MDSELRLIREEQARRFREQQQAGPPAAAPAPKPKGRVVCGKWFDNPPHQLDVRKMEELLNVYTRIKPQSEPLITTVNLDTDSGTFFGSFLQRAEFRIQRFGLLFGSVDWATKTVTVDCIYEPAQQGTPAGFAELPDPVLPTAEALANKMGLICVGWIFSHPLNRGDYFLTAAEVLKTAELTAKYGLHCVVLGIRQVQEDTLDVTADPFQVSTQCVEIYKERTLSPHPTEAHLIHSERELEAVKEQQPSNGGGKAPVLRNSTHDVNTILFTVAVGLLPTQSTITGNRFSRLNRPDHLPTLQGDVRNVLQQRSSQPYYQAINDFHLLLFLIVKNVINIETDVPIIVNAIQSKRDDLLHAIKRRITVATEVAAPAPAPKPAPRPDLPREPQRGPVIDPSKIESVQSICCCDADTARTALQQTNGDVTRAIELLL